METILQGEKESEQELGKNPFISFPEKIFSIFFSYVFHPLFIPLYVALFLVYIHPTAFAGFSDSERKQTILIISNLVFYPLLSVLLLKAVGFIQSVFLHSQKDRIIPYIASGIFYFWVYLVFKRQPQYPSIITLYVLGIFLASSVALIANIYFKISMHALGMGSWLGLFFIIILTNEMLMTWPISIVLLITGLVCSSRLLLYRHQPKDIYLGLFVGILTQLVAGMVML